MQFGIWCTRSAASPMGAAARWLEKDGKVWTVSDERDAQEEADRLNDLVKSGRVRFTAQPYQ